MGIRNWFPWLVVAKLSLLISTGYATQVALNAAADVNHDIDVIDVFCFGNDFKPICANNLVVMKISVVFIALQVDGWFRYLCFGMCRHRSYRELSQFALAIIVSR